MLANRQVTQQGVDWLTLATDPFHDTELSPTGFPDADCSRSIPQLYQYTATLAAPVGLTTTTWDAHVHFCPLSFTFGGAGANPLPLTRCTIDTTGVITNNSNSASFFPGYNAFGVDNGFNFVTGVTSPFVRASGINYPEGGSVGQHRLVACGVEVVNTTPDLYRGGSVTSYRSPNTQTVAISAAGAPAERFNSVMLALPPATSQEAQLYPASRTWGAEEGCYLVGTLDSSNNDYQATFGQAPILSQMPTNNQLAGGAWLGFCTANTRVGLPVNTSILPYDWHGSIFSGLNVNSTLQISVRYYIERIPTINQPDLLVLTRNPTPYDPVALEIYSRAMSELPVAVRINENPLGEWFNDIMDMVGTWAPRIGNGLGTFIPGASAIGQAVGGGASALGRLNRYGGNSVPAKPKPKPDMSVTNKDTKNSGSQSASNRNVTAKRRKPRRQKKPNGRKNV